MKIFRNALEASRAFPSAVVTIGKFDGIHRGHRRVLGMALARARALKTHSLVLTFDPESEQHTRLYSYRPLLSLAERLDQFRRLGFDAAVLLPFDRALACLSPQAFAENVLALQLKPLCVVVGEDFCFGKDRAGNIDSLERSGQGLGFLVESVPLLKDDGEKSSAARIRELIEKGEREKAADLLGRALG